MAQSVDPGFLLRVPPGWSIVGKQVIRQIDAAAPPDVQLEGFEWFDVSGLGVGGTQRSLSGVMQQYRTQLQNLGSDLYATALIKKTEVNFNFLGFQIGRVDRYRLIVCHSAAWIAGLVFLIAAALAAIIFFQYSTTGNSPLLDDLGRFWDALIKKTTAPIGPAITGAIVPVFIVGGILLIGYAVAAKELGVASAKPPHTRVGVKTGPLTTEGGT